MAWHERLPSGRYRGRYRDRQGHRRSLPHTYTQAAEAERAAAIREDEVRRRPAARARSARMTWGQWCDEWIAHHRTVEPGTAGRDESRIARHIRPHWENVPLRDIDRDAVAEWVDALRTTARQGSTQPLAARTVTKIVTVFSASMRDAVRAGHLDVSPCQYLQLDRPQADDEVYLTRDEHARLLAHADELTRMVVELAVGTGLRWGELVGLHRRRVVLDQRRVLVQEVYDKERREIKPYPKGRSRRGVPITDELADKLGEWMERNPARPCRTPHRSDGACRDSLLFATNRGTVLHYQNFRRRHWQRAVDAAGLLELTPHDLRHTYASWLIQSKRVTLDELGALLGHKDRSTTQRYAHLGEDHWDDVRGVLDPAVTGPVQNGSVEDDADAVPHLSHEETQEEGGKIIRLDRFRRTAG